MSEPTSTDARTSVIVRPGEAVPDSGVYEARTTHAALGRATLVKGDTAPPIREKGGYWVRVFDTNPDDRSSRAARPAVADAEGG